MECAGTLPAHGATVNYDTILFFWPASVVFVCVCVTVCALTWLLGRQRQLRVQVWAVVGVYPAFVFLPPAADPVQTNTWEVKKGRASIHSENAARQSRSWMERKY